MILNIPNSLTLTRIAFIPVIIALFYLPYEWARPASAWLYGLACVTDWFDGYLARKLGQSSAFGAFMDPVADKLIVSVALILLASAHPEVIIVLSTCIIIGREIVITALREWMAKQGKADKVAVSMMGKYKTFVQMFALGFLLHRDDWYGLPTHTIGLVLLIIAAILTVISMVDYMKAGWVEMKGDN
ncbi:CDP-diacylglycerol--glycerol-3-phosphate 3-phosphatidyltransferase [hydrothermal vent metagenome]|uniref:CDP-diacylglycerol--glycerol-3-phosphate 3-phosphatidyltransferase n=1 Tax=hydrothermal vent metagenome TaxID=652676 RepID=A0A3B0YPF3_9ZZZZ